VTPLEEAARLVAAGNVVAFTGAGMSAEAGIPTFRDPGGVWDRFDPDRFGTWAGLERAVMEHPDQVADFLAELRRVFTAARPTPGHVALARLEQEGLLDGVITQNVDGLHQEAGNGTVIEVHGSFLRLTGLACPHREEVDREGFAALMDRAVIALRSAFVPGIAAVLPRCVVDGAPMRPDFVAFGESPQRFKEAEALARRGRVLLVVGTSGEVLPAAILPELARVAGAAVVEVGTLPTQIEPDLRLRGRAGAVLPDLVSKALS
jgi:NAD-dependent deacetylase